VFGTSLMERELKLKTKTTDQLTKEVHQLKRKNQLLEKENRELKDQNKLLKSMNSHLGQELREAYDDLRSLKK
jgi:FtsZ-binding cell division protein ZapB